MDEIIDIGVTLVNGDQLIVVVKQKTCWNRQRPPSRKNFVVDVFQFAKHSPRGKSRLKGKVDSLQKPANLRPSTRSRLVQIVDRDRENVDAGGLQVSLPFYQFAQFSLTHRTPAGPQHDQQVTVTLAPQRLNFTVKFPKFQKIPKLLFIY